MQVKRYERRPLYRQIADDLQEQITGGVYRPGALLPTLAELTATYEVSDVTARHALSWLERHGIIALRHGKRSVVLGPQTDPYESYRRLSGQLVDLNRRMASILTRLEELTSYARTQSAASGTHRSS